MRGRFVRDLEKSRQSDAGARRGQLVRPKLDWCSVQHRGLDRKVQEQEKGANWLASPGIAATRHWWLNAASEKKDDNFRQCSSCHAE
jgi:hypothetical protein